MFGHVTVDYAEQRIVVYLGDVEVCKIFALARYETALGVIGGQEDKMRPKQFSAMKILEHLSIVKQIAKGENPYPVSYEVDPSNACNHNCIWCMYEGFMASDKSMIRRQMLRSIIDQIASLGGRSITFTGGGEPLTNPYTIEMMPYVRQNGISVGLVTNGGLLDEEKCRVIAENCSYVRISVDAGCGSTHAELHKCQNPKVDNYDKIITNISNLVEWKKKTENKIAVGTGFLVHPRNAREIFSFVKQVREINADYVQIRPVCTLNNEERQYVFHKSREEIVRSLELNDDGFGVFPMLNRFDEILAIERNYDVCLGHALVGIIGANCEMYLCCQLKGIKEYVLGNLKDKSIREIWHGKRRRHIAARLDLNRCPPCRYEKYNEILDYMACEEKPHTEFL